MNALTLVVLFTMFVLISASFHDVRSRVISDAHWMILCVMATVMAFFEHDIPCAILMAIGCILISVYMFSSRLVGLPGFFTVAAGCVFLALPYFLWSETSGLVTLMMTVFILILYRTGLLRGGADAKALISLSMLFPVYPEELCFLWEPVYPAGYVFNPVFSIILLALLMSLISSVRVLIINHRNGDKGMVSYSINLRDARGAFVWPVEDIVDGEKVRIRIRDDSEAVYDRLEAAGVDTVRVTPMIPFVLPITLAFVIVMILGSPLFLLLA